MSHVRIKTGKYKPKWKCTILPSWCQFKSLPETTTLSGGKGYSPLHAMQYSVYLLYTKTTESLLLLSMAEWAADNGLQEGWVSECSLTNDNIYSGKNRIKKNSLR